MHIEVDEKQLAILRELVDSRISELHPMIRRSRVSACTDALKADLRELERLARQLASAKEVSLS